MARVKEEQHSSWKQALLGHFASAYKGKIHSGFKELKEKKKTTPPRKQTENPKGPKLQPFLDMSWRQLNNSQRQKPTCLKRNKCILKLWTLYYGFDIDVFPLERL